ncbi:hypothetical protein BCR35DRAFT_297923 [Leucosporidium creatinivorum]|uniref:Uncharacterized protein n=1 Tax=Leucosporidium creatinivorum TaxID=106004 RepID=A0A1Y2G5Z5_9BASI|nr:hypothetical protein BCR35DRAFT_297923 [Leucosporidium creatinivorum]
MSAELRLRDRPPLLVDAAELRKGVVALSEGVEGERREKKLNDRLQDFVWERGDWSRGFAELGRTRGAT